jgi:hypothetical protein
LNPIPFRLRLDTDDSSSTAIVLESYGEELGQWTIGPAQALEMVAVQQYTSAPTVTLRIREAGETAWAIDEIFEDGADGVRFAGRALIDVDAGMLTTRGSTVVSMFVREGWEDVIPGMEIQVIDSAFAALNGTWRVLEIDTPAADGTRAVTFDCGAIEDDVPRGLTNTGTNVKVLLSRPVTVEDAEGIVASDGTIRATVPGIAGYLGDTDAFDEAVAEFAMAYAAITQADHAALVAWRG